MPPNGAGARARRSGQRQAKLDHRYPDPDGVTWHDRAAFEDEPAVNRAINRIRALTGRSYCTWRGCDAWHIRQSRRRAQDLARPA